MNRKVGRRDGGLWLLLSATAVSIIVLSGCGGSSSNAAGNNGSTSSTAASPQEERDSHCVEQWNSGRFPGTGGPQSLARRVLLTTEGQAIVTTDRNGICLVAFAESAGSAPGEGGGDAYTFSLEKGSWGLYLLIGHESYSLNPAILEEQQGAVNARVALMEELGREVEVDPNAVLDSRGKISLLGSPSSAGKPQGADAETQSELVEEDDQEETPVSLEEELLGALEKSRNGPEGPETELSELRTAGEYWTAATVSTTFPGQGADNGTAIFHKESGEWTLFEIGSSFVGSSHCPPRLIAVELEVECGPSPTESSRPSAEDSEHQQTQTVESDLRSHFAYLEAGEYGKAYDGLTSREGESLGGESNWIADQRQDRLTGHELSVGVEFEGATRAKAVIDEFRTRSVGTGCQSWSGSWTVVEEGGRWLIEGADLEAEPCG